MNKLFLPDDARIIMPPSPVCSINEFVRMTGKSRSAVVALIDSGEIPVLQKKARNAAVEINLMEYSARLLEDAGRQVVAVSVA